MNRFASSGAALNRKLLGHFGYFAVIGNLRALRRLRPRVIAVSEVVEPSLATGIDLVEEMNRLLERYPLPQPRIRPSPVTQ